MALKDLEALGYQVFYPPEDMMPPTGPSVVGYDRQWNLLPDGDEAAVETEARNHKILYDKLTQAQDYFSGTYSNWPTMTAQQKDTANRNAQRALANLVRHVRNDLSSEGT